MKYSIHQWNQHNSAKIQHAQRARTIVEGLRDEAARALEETSKHTKNTQRAVTTRLNQRVQKVDHWQGEIEHKLHELNNEIDTLLNLKDTVNEALKATVEPVKINRHCQALREQRTDVENVHDVVEKDLAKEIDVILSCADVLADCIEQITEQIRKNRSARYHLEKDKKDKSTAHSIDDEASQLHNNMANAQRRPLTAKITLEGYSTPSQWQNFTEVNVAKAEKERDNSRDLRGVVEGILRRTTENMTEANRKCSFQFSERVKETKIAKKKMTSELDHVMQEVSALEKSILDLEEGIKAKEGSLMVCETRMDMRQARPNYEYCVDSPHKQLRAENSQINENISRLVELLHDATVQMKDLKRQQLELQEEIKIKENTIYIDEVCCIAERESISFKFF